MDVGRQSAGPESFHGGIDDQPRASHLRSVRTRRNPRTSQSRPLRRAPVRAYAEEPDSRVWPLANVWGPRMKRCVWASPHPATGSRVEDRHDDGKVRPPTAPSCRAPWPCARRRSCAHWSRGVRRAGSARNAGMRLQRKHGANRTRRQHVTHVRWRHPMASRAASCRSPGCYLQVLSGERTASRPFGARLAQHLDQGAGSQRLLSRSGLMRVVVL